MPTVPLLLGLCVCVCVTVWWDGMVGVGGGEGEGGQVALPRAPFARFHRVGCCRRSAANYSRLLGLLSASRDLSTVPLCSSFTGLRAALPQLLQGRSMSMFASVC